ncbi:MAG TPA: HAMP domain-containing sensor histidine kinase [Burkholderiaceae bacterium]|nr:HAMP domain-containing sensor histidine kinase [Burkholderiaceae bacterium]
MLSLRTRLVLGHQAAIVVVLLLAAVGTYWTLVRSVHGQLDAALLALAETELGMLATGNGQPVRVHEVAPGPAPPAFERLDRLVQIVDGDGHVLARSSNLGEAALPVSPALLARLAHGEVVFETLAKFGSEPTRMVSVPVTTPGAARAIQVAGSLDDVNHVVESAGIVFVVMGAALLLAVGAAGALLTRRVFRAIDDVVQQAHRIGEADLGRRLPHPGTADEVGRLVETLNEMLGRLERSFEAQRRFTADASHELRSPLSRLRTELELALRRPRDAADYVETLRSCMEEVERLTLLVEELLVLARIDAGQERGPVEAVSLNVLAEEAIQRVRPMARDHDVRVALDPAPPVAARVARGPASLVLANLLSNAVKFSGQGGQVSVGLHVEESAAVIRVADSGPGLGVMELPYLFDRFYRGSAARAGGVPGVGLGLALSQAIVQAHGGSIEASNREPRGALFTVRLPLAA